MTDILTPDARSALMARVRGKDTKIELVVRRGLHARGFRYRLGGAGLPGRPDIVLPKYRTVVFVHGCFWHGHDCPLYRLPKTRPDFWRAKVDANRARDQRAIEKLESLGWRSIVVWECGMRGLPAEATEKLVTALAADIRMRPSLRG